MNNKFFQNSKHEDDSVIFELILEETLRDFDYDIDDISDEAIIEQIVYNSSLYGYVLNELTFREWIRQAGKVQIGKPGKALIAGKDSYALDAAKRAAKNASTYVFKPVTGMTIDATKAGAKLFKDWATKKGTKRAGVLDIMSKIGQLYKQNIPRQQPPQPPVNRVRGRIP